MCNFLSIGAVGNEQTNTQLWYAVARRYHVYINNYYVVWSGFNSLGLKFNTIKLKDQLGKMQLALLGK